MSEVDTGSYIFDSYGKQETELQMLERQASLAFDIEKSIWRESGLKPDMKVLDMGCGSGITSLFLAEYVSDGYVVGIDPSKVLINKANDFRKEKACGNLRFDIGDVYDSCQEKESFDFIYCRLLFQHLRNPVKALKSLHKLLKPGGFICIVDIDDSAVFLYPEPEKLSSLITRAARNQKAEGGDRYVGRKLPFYLNSAGFNNSAAFIKQISSDNVGMKAFLKSSFDFRIERLQEDEYELALEELSNIYTVLDAPFAWGSLGIFAATGRK